MRGRYENELDLCRRAVRDAAQRAIEVLVFSADGDLETQKVARDVALWRSQARDTRNSGSASTLVPVTHIKTVLSKLEEYAKQWRNDRTLFLRNRLHQQQQQEAAAAAVSTTTNLNSHYSLDYDSSENVTHGPFSGNRERPDRRSSSNTNATSNQNGVCDAGNHTQTILRTVTPIGTASSGGSSSATTDVVAVSQDSFADGEDVFARKSLEKNINIAATSSDERSRLYSSESIRTSPANDNKDQSTYDCGNADYNSGDYGTTIIRSEHGRNEVNNQSQSNAAPETQAETSSFITNIGQASFPVAIAQNDDAASENSSAFPWSVFNPKISSLGANKLWTESSPTGITLASYWPSTWPQASNNVAPPPGLGIVSSSKWSEVVKGGDSSGKVRNKGQLCHCVSLVATS